MRLPVFTSFIMIVIITNLAIRRSNEKARRDEENFWEKESRANSTRRKSLDSLAYITIPIDELPFGVVKNNAEVDYCEKNILRLADQKIVNFTGITNTDLKLEYGAPNITLLTNYDQNYTTLVTMLQKWAGELSEAGFYKEAASILEFSISTRSDVTASYKLLCDLYKNKLSLSDFEIKNKIKTILPIAENLNSLSKDNIVYILNECLGENELKEQTS